MVLAASVAWAGGAVLKTSPALFTSTTSPAPFTFTLQEVRIHASDYNIAQQAVYGQRLMGVEYVPQAGVLPTFCICHAASMSALLLHANKSPHVLRTCESRIMDCFEVTMILHVNPNAPQKAQRFLCSALQCTMVYYCCKTQGALHSSS